MKLLSRQSLTAFAAMVLCSAAGLHGQANEPLPESLRSELVKKHGGDETRYLSASADLDKDGKAEIIVHIVSRMECGSGGCTTLIFKPEAAGYRQVSSISPTQLPIRLSPRSAAGWRNLIVGISGGGVKAGNAELPFNGKSYASNPTVPPARRITDLSGSTILIAESQSQSDTGNPPILPSTPAEQASPSVGAVRPSFDCAHASNPAEKRICSDSQLATLDQRLSQIYNEALKQGSTGDKERENQRKWLATRDECGASAHVQPCLEFAYQKRIAELQIASGRLKQPIRATYSCEGREKSPIRAAFYNQTDPASAVITIDGKQEILIQQRTGSGIKYAAPNLEFTEHQGDATFTVAGTNYNCKPSK